MENLSNKKDIINDHFIPEFLQKNFVEVNGKVYVFNKFIWQQKPIGINFSDLRYQRKAAEAVEFSDLPKNRKTSLITSLVLPVDLGDQEIFKKQLQSTMIPDTDYCIFNKSDSDFGSFVNKVLKDTNKAVLGNKKYLILIMELFFRTNPRVVSDVLPDIEDDSIYISSINHIMCLRENFDKLFDRYIDVKEINQNIIFTFDFNDHDGLVMTDNPVLFTDTKGNEIFVQYDEVNHIENFFELLSAGFFCFLPLSPQTLVVIGYTRKFNSDYLLNIFLNTYLIRNWKSLISKFQQESFIFQIRK